VYPYYYDFSSNHLHSYITIDEIRLLLMQVYSDDPPETEVKFLMDVFDRNKVCECVCVFALCLECSAVQCSAMQCSLVSTAYTHAFHRTAK
jgi:hypothetical protein